MQDGRIARFKTKMGLAVLVISSIFVSMHVRAYPIQVTDAMGLELQIKQRPQRVVSLVPSASEIIFALDAQDALQAVTHHSTNLKAARGKAVVGGFFAPSSAWIEKARPDLILLAPLHRQVIAQYAATGIPLVRIETRQMADAERNIRLLGRIFNRPAAAEDLIAKNRQQLAFIRDKVAAVPAARRKRVVRFMGRGKVMVPGDDSFQNELIAAAGGIPPVWGRKGTVVTITAAEWQRFNPQVIYGCGGDRQAAQSFFTRPGWKAVDAVKNGQIYYFPCDLTCRAATHTGYFVSWLASAVYAQAFAREEHRLRPDQVFESRPVTIELPYIKTARVARSTIYDFINKTLIIDFSAPQTVVSTLEGQRQGILTVGNHYSPPQCWAIGHQKGLTGLRAQVYDTIGQSADTSAFLFTGADMDNLSIRTARFRAMTVYALVTAGVRSNAVRMSRDAGNFYEPGTINIVLMTNMQLSARAMTRAIISATEAKTAALTDMDVRSAYQPARWRATGTGTDNIIVVQGTGVPIDNAGGHTKLGELIAAAVHAGVQEAVRMQDGLAVPRNIFQRLAERRLSVYQLVAGANCDCEEQRSLLAAAVEETLLNPRYAAFVAAALALSDAYENGLIADLGAFELWCRQIAADIAGRSVDELEKFLSEDQAPVVLRTAMDAVLNGVRSRM